MSRIAVLTSATAGGGGIAAVRVFNSIVIVKSEDDTVDILNIESLGGPVPEDVAYHSGGSNKVFSDTHYTVEFPGYVRSEIVERLIGYDAINIHWCSYLLTLAEIKEVLDSGKTVVFTCHDFYYFLGGCHYPHTCTSWQSGCVTCPQLNTERFPDYSPRDNLEFKRRLFSYKNAWLVSPSNYLTGMATAILFDAANQPLTIRNPLDSKIFFKHSQPISRDKDKLIRILMVADSARERRKAFPLGIQAVMNAAIELAGQSIQLELWIVGGNADYLAEGLARFPTPVKLLGKLTPEDLANVYRSVDIVFSPSLEDNWPNILVEAYACGARFIVGPGHGCEEFVKLYDCGMISASYNINDFTEVIIDLSTSLSTSRELVSPDRFQIFRADHNAFGIGRKYLQLLGNL
jgi:glycosyltransferase involved in cell wall biosynthesis